MDFHEFFVRILRNENFHEKHNFLLNALMEHVETKSRNFKMQLEWNRWKKAQKSIFLFQVIKFSDKLIKFLIS